MEVSNWALVAGRTAIVCAGMAAVAVMPASAVAQRAEDAFGVWQHPDNDSVIEIYPCRDRLCGKILSIADGQRTDDKNPDPRLRGRPIKGLAIVDGAVRTGDDRWSGTLYNRNDGRDYDGHIRVLGRDRLELTGCAVVVLCRTVVWRRAK